MTRNNGLVLIVGGNKPTYLWQGAFYLGLPSLWLLISMETGSALALI